MPHQGAAWYEAAVGRLAGRLLRVANGLVPTDVEKIVDIDLTQIPQLPATHAHYERRLEARLRAERDNARNRTERQEIYIRDWTDTGQEWLAEPGGYRGTADTSWRVT